MAGAGLPLSVRAGAGEMRYWEGVSNTYRGRATGLALHLGLQYEARIGGRWVLTPLASYSTAVTSHASVNGSTAASGIEPSMIQVEIGLAWH